MKENQSRQLRRYERKSLEHAYQCQKLEELFGLAIEAYILINAANLLVKGSVNWTTADGNSGQPLDADLYAQNETIFLSSMSKLLESKPGRRTKMLFIELVISLAVQVNNQFAPLALEVIKKYQLEMLAKDRFYLAKTT